MASEVVKRTFKPAPGRKPVAWKLDGDWLFRQDEAVLNLVEVTRGSWFAGQMPRGLPHHELILHSTNGSVLVRAHGSDRSPDTREMRRLVVKTLDRVGEVAPDASFRIGADPIETAMYFLLGLFLMAVAVVVLFAGEIVGLVPVPLGIYLVWKWRPWTARLNLTAAEVLADIGKQ